MLKAEQIPDEVVLELWEATGEDPVGVLACLVDAKIYLAAAINAWPGMGPIRTDQPIGDWCDKLPAIILPLSEKQNAK